MRRAVGLRTQDAKGVVGAHGGGAPADKPMLTTQVANKLPYGVNIAWKEGQKLLQTGKPDLLVTEIGSESEF